jgi:hypothetical protein
MHFSHIYSLCFAGMLSTLDKYCLQTVDEIHAAALALAAAAKGNMPHRSIGIAGGDKKSLKVLGYFFPKLGALRCFSLCTISCLLKQCRPSFCGCCADKGLPRGAVNATRLCAQLLRFFPDMQLSPGEVAATAQVCYEYARIGCCDAC